MPTDPYSLTASEFLLVAGLAGLIGWEVWRSWRSADPARATQPTVIVGAVLTYYSLIGPLRAIASGEWVDRGLNLRGTMVWAWAGSLLFYAALLLGYYALPRWSWRSRFSGITLPSQRWRELGGRLNILGLGLYSLAVGPSVVAQFNPFGAGEALQNVSGSGVDLGGFGNYFSLSLNFLIPGTLLLFCSWVRDRHGGISVVFWTLAAAGLFTTAGFRWRLVVLLVPMALLWFVARQRRPKLAFMAVVATGLILIAGFVGLTRTYGAGLDTSRIEGQETAEIFDAGFAEAHIFLTTGGLIAQTPERYPFVGLTPLINTATFFVPRQLWPDKGSNEYISDAAFTLYGGPQAGGSALLNIAEYYLMFGWPSLLAMSLLLGIILRSLYSWYLLNRGDISAQVIYTTAICFLYVVISRGYLPQVVSLLAFTVLPLGVARVWVFSRARPMPASQPDS